MSNDPDLSFFDDEGEITVSYDGYSGFSRHPGDDDYDEEYKKMIRVFTISGVGLSFFLAILIVIWIIDCFCPPRPDDDSDYQESTATRVELYEDWDNDGIYYENTDHILIPDTTLDNNFEIPRLLTADKATQAPEIPVNTVSVRSNRTQDSEDEGDMTRNSKNAKKMKTMENTQHGSSSKGSETLRQRTKKS